MTNLDDHEAPRIVSESSDSAPRFPNRLPGASSPAAQQRMRATRQRDTKPERLLCEQLDRLGLAYTTNQSPMPGFRRHADVCFSAERVAVFVDGCFWHGCPQHGTLPKANHDWWKAKIDANQWRDANTNRTLEQSGWIVLRFWEHEPADKAARVIANVVGCRRLDPSFEI